MQQSSRLDEIESIRETRISYTHYYDAGDVEGVVSVFTADAVIEAGPYGRAEGRDAIREFYADRIAETGPTQKIVTNPLIRITGPDTAHGRWYLTDVMIGWAEPGKDPLTLRGTYTDQYRKENGEWKICRMQVDIKWPPQQP